MSKTVILTEKPSAARNFAKAFGGRKGTYQGVNFEIVNARGHLLEFVDPHEQVAKELKETFKKWSLDTLPWDHSKMVWRKKVSAGNTQTITSIKKSLIGADTVVIATDNDPSGEGDMIGWEILEHLKFNGTIQRMHFEDEEEKELIKGWENRFTLNKDPKKNDMYMKAYVRERWDFLSMQLVRACTVLSREQGYNTVVRAGRLKSVIVKLVYDQIKERKDYVRKPYFEVKFRDDQGHVYSRSVDPDDPDINNIRFDSKLAAKNDLKNYTDPGTPKLVSKIRKRQAPPKLLDLQGLAAILAPKGYSAKEILATYQKLYEAELVSYPRTEDKYVTIEQFKIFEEHANQVANLVGVDTKYLTQRQARSTHVKKGQAHGANRPGKKVPTSIDELKKYGKSAVAIYTLLAKNSLAMLAEDYEYDAYQAIIAEEESFKTSFTVPVSKGFKAVFDPKNDEEEEPNTKSLGSKARLIVDEGANKKPPLPSQKWLKKRLEKHKVGTGATRLSTISEISEGKNTLLKDTKGVFSETQTGLIAWCFLENSWIGDVATTERLFDLIDQVGQQKQSDQYVIDTSRKLIDHDIKVFQENAKKIPSIAGKALKSNKAIVVKDKVSGKWNGKEVSFNVEWGGIRFSDDQVSQLLRGETIEVKGKKNGKEYTAVGSLQEQKYKGKEFIGFKLDKFK